MQWQLSLSWRSEYKQNVQTFFGLSVGMQGGKSYAFIYYQFLVYSCLLDIFYSVAPTVTTTNIVSYSPPIFSQITTSLNKYLVVVYRVDLFRMHGSSKECPVYRYTEKQFITTRGRRACRVVEKNVVVTEKSLEAALKHLLCNCRFSILLIFVSIRADYFCRLWAILAYIKTFSSFRRWVLNVFIFLSFLYL